MKSNTYDRIFDNLTSAFLHLAFFATVYAVWFGLFSLFIFYYDIMTWIAYWIYGAAIIPAIITSIILVSYKIAVDRFDIVQYRDIWMAWSTSLKYDIDKYTLVKCEEWIDKNITGLHRIRAKNVVNLYTYEGTDIISFIFKQKTDAMAFKLMWNNNMSKDNS